jgi:hypothetical protein
MIKLAQMAIFLLCNLWYSNQSSAQNGITWGINPKFGTVYSHNDFRSPVTGLLLLYGPKNMQNSILKMEIGSQISLFSERELEGIFPKEKFTLWNNIVWAYYDINVLRLQFVLGLGSLLGKFRDHDEPPVTNPIDNSLTFQTKKIGYFNTSIILGAKLIPGSFVTLGLEFEAMVNRFRPMLLPGLVLRLGDASIGENVQSTYNS